MIYMFKNTRTKTKKMEIEKRIPEFVIIPSQIETKKFSLASNSNLILCDDCKRTRIR